MSKHVKYLCCAALLIVFSSFFSCYTIESEVNHFPLEVKDTNIESELVIMSNKWISLDIRNDSDDVVVIITDLASFTYNNKVSRLIPEGTKYIDATRSQPNILIPPKTTSRTFWTNSDSIQYKSSGQSSNWVINPWIPSDLSQCTFVFGYNINNTNKYLIFKGSDILKLYENYDKVGQIHTEKVFWNILFISASYEVKKESVYNKALEEAKSTYGDNILLSNIVYKHTSWDIRSMLLYFSMLGYVETITLDANVYKAKN